MLTLQKRKKNVRADETWRQLSRRVYHFLRKHLPRLFVRSETEVRKALSVLPDAGKKTAEDHFAEKTGLVLTVLLAGMVLAFAAHKMTLSENAVSAEGTLSRGTYGKAAVSKTLEAKTEEGEILGEFDMVVEPVRYTTEEAQQLFAEASKLLPDAILNGNESLRKVTGPLSLVKSLPGYPFRIEWSSGNYARLRTDGVPVTDDLTTGGEAVDLTAHYRYGDAEWEQVIQVLVRPVPKTPEEQIYSNLMDELAYADEASAFEETMPLPESYQGARVIWRSVEDDSAPVLVLLTLIVAAGVWFSRDENLRKRIRDREDALAGEYAGFVSKLTLYMSAGMTVRSVFLKLGDDYEKNRKADVCGMSFLMEEVKRAANELKSGMSEQTAYEHFAARCDIQEYAKLTSLLTQNLKKGSTHLLPLLHEEVRLAVEGRMDRAKVRGEQANTKLMLPMMMMLGVVMVLVMVPAFMSF